MVMKLSDGIRLGAMVLPRPSKSHICFDFDAGDNICGACALGCAIWAAHINERHPTGWLDGDWSDAIKTAFPIVMAVVEPPADGVPAGWNVGQIVSCLFETKRWTREHIADWVATVEDAQEVQKSGDPVVTLSQQEG